LLTKRAADGKNDTRHPIREDLRHVAKTDLESRVLGRGCKRLNRMCGWLMSNVRVYIVDDYPLVREGIRRLLELDARIRVVGEADSGEIALDKVTTSSPKVVLMDVNLPGINGVETTRLLTSQHPQLRVLMLSSFGDQFLLESLEAGACGFILKSATQPEMVNAVLRAAGGDLPIDPKLITVLLNRNGVQSETRGRQALPNRQVKILRLISDGLTSKKITSRLSISEATLTRDLRHIFDFLGVDDRAHAVAAAYRNKIL